MTEPIFEMSERGAGFDRLGVPEFVANPPCVFCRRGGPCGCAGEACMCACGRCPAPERSEGA